MGFPGTVWFLILRLSSRALVAVAPKSLTERGVTLMYLGPDVLMPLASAFAAVAGVVLMFWRKIVNATRSVGQFISRSGRRS
jgi:hypothetical protein